MSTNPETQPALSPDAQEPLALRTLAKEFKVSRETIRRHRVEGWTDSQIRDYYENKATPPNAAALPFEPNYDPGLKNSIERLRQAEVLAYQDFINASGGKDKATKQRAWGNILESLRKVESENPDIEQKNDNTINREDLAQSLTFLFNSLRVDLEGLGGQAAAECEGKSKEAIKQIIDGKAANIMEGLYACQYLRN